jgi:endonuclease/exonuclease/phosphatase family metal-dependent hydrolase
MANPAIADATPQPPGLSVLTYNVEGLPWPVRSGRAQQARKIAASLRDLRASGTQPHVIVLQEAFTPFAKAIATEAGYRYIADGPASSDPGAPPITAEDRKFAREASAFKGETLGKWADSGLRIASDYPILAVRRMPFPSYACAGTDCLANKGMVAVTVAMPGLPQPIVIVATHLNACKASGVSFARSLYAYRRQIDALGQFIRANVSPSTPMVLAGDFNVGKRIERRAYLLQSVAAWRPRTGVWAALDNCLAVQACAKTNSADLGYSYRRGKDWQFYSPGTASGLRVAALAAVFGHDSAGSMLSDHVGYSASYTISASMPSPTRLATR